VAERVGGEDYWFRVNTKDGKHTLLRPPEKTQWLFHTDYPRVDLAIADFYLPNNVDWLAFPDTAILNETGLVDKQLGIGDEVVMPGLFYPARGNSRNTPIARMGSLALIPDHDLPGQRGAVEATLIEVRSVGGMSGSPVYIRSTVPSNVRQLYMPGEVHFENIPGKWWLLGIVIQHWETDPDDINEPYFEALPRSEAVHRGVNVGVAMIVRAHRLKDLLYRHDVVIHRREVEAIELSTMSTPDGNQ
jgi:hypothetical protein